MSAASIPPEVDSPPRESGAAPFATVNVTITKQEHIQLKTAAQQWQILHRKALGRSKWREERYQRILRELKVRCAKTEAKLRTELEFAQAKIRDLQKRLFAGKSERSKGCEAKTQGAACHAHRGHQRGAPGHGRTMQPHLPARDEFVEIEKPQCPRCGLELRPFPGTEDSEVLEIEVKAYRRVIHRCRYVPTCQCGCLAGIITAPPPARLIKRGKFGISVWTSVLLDKYLYGRQVNVCCKTSTIMVCTSQQARSPVACKRSRPCLNRLIRRSWPNCAVSRTGTPMRLGGRYLLKLMAK